MNHILSQIRPEPSIVIPWPRDLRQHALPGFAHPHGPVPCAAFLLDATPEAAAPTPRIFCCILPPGQLRFDFLWITDSTLYLSQLTKGD